LRLGQCPVIRYNRQLMQAILHDKIQIAKAVNVQTISLDDAPSGYTISIRARRRSTSSTRIPWCSNNGAICLRGDAYDTHRLSMTARAYLHSTPLASQGASKKNMIRQCPTRSGTALELALKWFDVAYSRSANFRIATAMRSTSARSRR
jgi:hypothetical protein